MTSRIDEKPFDPTRNPNYMGLAHTPRQPATSHGSSTGKITRAESELGFPLAVWGWG
jgi:hypothetical protein